MKFSYAPVNGIQLYYEVHGSGDPLVMLHGGLGSVEMWGPTVTALAASRQVIAVDLYGHGHTGFVDGRTLSNEEMADDIGALIAHLGLARADVMGYSLGAGVAVQTAIRHRDRVRRAVIVSTTFRRDGWFPEALAGFDALTPALAEMMKPSPAYQHYAKVAPRPEDFGKLIGATGDLGRRDFDWTTGLAGFPPALLVYGDADAVRPAHIMDVYARLGGGLHDPRWDGSAGRSASQLAILPGVNHYDLPVRPELAATVERFLASTSAG